MSGFTARDVPDQKGRTILVTGANSGIGFEAAKVLAEKCARVLLGCRDEVRGRWAAKRIERAHSHAKVEWLPLDLSDLASVREAAKRLRKLDVLVNNAGIMRPPLGHAKDGFELQFGINHLGHFALTGLLLEKLGGPDPRVVTVSSIAHRRGRIDFANLDGKAGYQRSKFYAQSKLANLMFTLELDRRLRAGGSPVKSIGCHPGIAGTGLGRHGRIDALIEPAGNLLFNSSERGALPTLQAATDPSAQGGDYFGPKHLVEMRGDSAPGRIASRARNEDVARRLWDVSVELTGVDPGLAAAYPAKAPAFNWSM